MVNLMTVLDSLANIIKSNEGVYPNRVYKFFGEKHPLLEIWDYRVDKDKPKKIGTFFINKDGKSLSWHDGSKIKFNLDLVEDSNKPPKQYGSSVTYYIQQDTSPSSLAELANSLAEDAWK